MEKKTPLVHIFVDYLLFPVEKSTTKKEELAGPFLLHPAWLEEEDHVARGAAQSLLMNRAEQIAKSDPGRNCFFQADGADGFLGCPGMSECSSELGTAIIQNHKNGCGSCSSYSHGIIILESTHNKVVDFNGT